MNKIVVSKPCLYCHLRPMKKGEGFCSTTCSENYIERAFARRRVKSPNDGTLGKVLRERPRELVRRQIRRENGRTAR